MRVDNFQIDYREDGSERQFMSDLSVIDAATGRQLSSQHISVNKPLRWGAHPAFPQAHSGSSAMLHGR